MIESHADPPVGATLLPPDQHAKSTKTPRRLCPVFLADRQHRLLGSASCFRGAGVGDCIPIAIRLTRILALQVPKPFTIE